jgi:uncharacterized protein YgiM (DUF1202 family)
MWKLSILSIFMMALTALFVPACQKPQPESAPAQVFPETEASPIATYNDMTDPIDDWEDSPAQVTDSGAYGYVLRPFESLYLIKNDTGADTDIATWGMSMNFGEKYSVLSPPRKAVFQGTSYEFVEILRETGEEGYILGYYFAPGGSLAVVTDDNTRIYNSPKNIDVTGTILTRGTMVVWFPETVKDGYTEFKAYDPYVKQWYMTKKYIRRATLSTDQDDIQSVILFQTARALLPAPDKPDNNRARREALLEAAIMEYPDSAFSAEIRALVHPNIAVRSSSLGILMVNDDKVNIRDRPDPATGNVIGQLNTGTEVTVTEETVNTYTIGDHTAKWYHIVEPRDGWVFGAFLSDFE